MPITKKANRSKKTNPNKVKVGLVTFDDNQWHLGIKPSTPETPINIQQTTTTAPAPAPTSTSNFTQNDLSALEERIAFLKKREPLESTTVAEEDELITPSIFCEFFNAVTGRISSFELNGGINLTSQGFALFLSFFPHEDKTKINEKIYWFSTQLEKIIREEIIPKYRTLDSASEVHFPISQVGKEIWIGTTNNYYSTSTSTNINIKFHTK